MGIAKKIENTMSSVNITHRGVVCDQKVPVYIYNDHVIPADILTIVNKLKPKTS